MAGNSQLHAMEHVSLVGHLQVQHTVAHDFFSWDFTDTLYNGTILSLVWNSQLKHTLDFGGCEVGLGKRRYDYLMR